MPQIGLRGLSTLEIPASPIVFKNVLIDELLSHSARYKLRLVTNY